MQYNHVQHFTSLIRRMLKVIDNESCKTCTDSLPIGQAQNWGNEKCYTSFDYLQNPRFSVFAKFSSQIYPLIRFRAQLKVKGKIEGPEFYFPSIFKDVDRCESVYLSFVLK